MNTGKTLVALTLALGFFWGCASVSSHQSSGPAAPMDDVTEIKGLTEAWLASVEMGGIDPTDPLASGKPQTDGAVPSSKGAPIDAHTSYVLQGEIDVEVDAARGMAWSRFSADATYFFNGENVVERVQLAAEFSKMEDGWKLVNVYKTYPITPRR